MSYARSPRLVDSMTIGTSIWGLPAFDPARGCWCDGGGRISDARAGRLGGALTVSSRRRRCRIVVMVVVVVIVRPGSRPGSVAPIDAAAWASGGVDRRRCPSSSRWSSGGCSGWAASQLVDERLDDPGPAERAADEVAAALRLEVADDLLVLVARRAPVRPRPRCPVRDRRCPRSRRSSVSTSSTLVRCSARGRNSAWSSASVWPVA